MRQIEEFNRLVSLARSCAPDDEAKRRLCELVNRTYNGVKNHPWVGEVLSSIAVLGGGMLVAFHHNRWAAAQTTGD